MIGGLSQVAFFVSFPSARPRPVRDREMEYDAIRLQQRRRLSVAAHQIAHRGEDLGASLHLMAGGALSLRTTRRRQAGSDDRRRRNAIHSIAECIFTGTTKAYSTQANTQERLCQRTQLHAVCLV